jgi:hypothetical protein
VSRLPGVAVLLLSAALLPSGCGGGDDKKDNAPAQTTAAESDAPLKIDDVKTRLLANGYKVENRKPGPLIRNAASRGGLVVAEKKIEVTGGELPSGSGGVSVYSFSAPEDVAAMERFAGGDRSLVKGSLFFQAVEPGAAQTVADAASG